MSNASAHRGASTPLIACDSFCERELNNNGTPSPIQGRRITWQTLIEFQVGSIVEYNRSLIENLIHRETGISLKDDFLHARSAAITDSIWYFFTCVSLVTLNRRERRRKCADEAPRMIIMCEECSTCLELAATRATDDFFFANR